MQYDTRCPLCRAPAPNSETEQLRLLQKHADKGIPEAQMNLGDVHRDGCAGLKQSFKRAVELYQLAAA